MPNIDKAVLSVHCHNDLGLAVANSLRAVQAAFGAAFIEAIPGGTEVAQLVGVDPVKYAKRQMFEEMGLDANHSAASGNAKAPVSPSTVKRVSRVLVRFTGSAFKGRRFAGIVAKRGNLFITVAVSLTSGITAYRELTMVGFAALGEA